MTLVLVACSSKTPAPVQPIQRDAPVAATTAPPGAPVATVHTPGRARGVIEAPHGGMIVALATTDDGRAALSCDELGGVRLWPALDGSREPRVVDLPPPRQLAVGARPDGFAIAALDEVGGIVVALVDGDGLTKTRATFPGDPPFTAIAMTELGLLALRSDQVLMILAPDGSSAGRLATDPGQRVVTWSISNGRAVVALETAGSSTPRVRWLALAPKLGWGGWIATEEEIGTEVALAPGGKRLATRIPLGDKRPGKTIVIDITSGKALVSDLLRDALGLTFADDDHLAIPGAGGFSWIDLTVAKPAASAQIGPV